MFTSIDMQRAQKAVRQAKRVLRAAEHRFDAEYGPDNSSALIADIKLAEKRLAEATAKLRDIE